MYMSLAGHYTGLGGELLEHSFCVYICLYLYEKQNHCQRSFESFAYIMEF